MLLRTRAYRGIVATLSALAVVAGLASTAIVAPASAVTSGLKNPSATTPRAATLPGVPTRVRTIQWGNGSATIAWDAPASTGGAALTDFEVK